MSFEINYGQTPTFLLEEVDIDTSECDGCKYADGECFDAGYCILHQGDPK